MGMDYETARMPARNEVRPEREHLSIAKCCREAMGELRTAEAALIEVIRMLFGDDIQMANNEDGNSIAEYIEALERQAHVILNYSEALAQKLGQ